MIYSTGCESRRRTAMWAGVDTQRGYCNYAIKESDVNPCDNKNVFSAMCCHVHNWLPPTQLVSHCPMDVLPKDLWYVLSENLGAAMGKLAFKQVQNSKERLSGLIDNSIDDIHSVLIKPTGNMANGLPVWGKQVFMLAPENWSLQYEPWKASGGSRGHIILIISSRMT